MRSYVSKFDDNGAYCVRTIHAQLAHPSFLEIENSSDFIRWIDQDWRRIEILNGKHAIEFNKPSENPLPLGMGRFGLSAEEMAKKLY